MKVLVPLAEGVEEKEEAVIIIDPLRGAGWEVLAVGLKLGEVRASRGVRLLPEELYAAAIATAMVVG